MAEPSGRVKIGLFFAFLGLATLACGSQTPRRLNLYPSPTVLPTQTERVVIHTSTPALTYTPIVKVVTSTPEPEYLCVTANENVYLRPSADLSGYPIAPLPKGTRLMDLGGRDKNFAFVSNGKAQGWVSLKYLKNCN